MTTGGNVRKMSTESYGAKELPINAFRSRIAEAVRDNAVVVLIGETGSGKTTQLPQILADEGFVKGGMVGVTQPRRMAAVSVARRVAWERKCEVGEEVGYAVRFEERASRRTRIKYLTDGTLLREFLFDPHLSRYDVVMLDEAHERGLNTDILLGLMKRLLASRRQHGFRVVVTSATLDSKKVAAYFGSCPVLEVPGRVYPVKVVHSLEDHSQAYEQAAVDTALDIHVTRPQGDILVFLTGQAEVEAACRKLQAGVEALALEDAGPLLVLPLYAALPPELQARVFAPAPPGCRRCVVATNVAETSVTVDGVVYVVDAGMVKVREYDARTGMDSLKVKPISRVQAAQRTGRAGRTRPGMCFRLFTKEAHEEMPEEAVPEIQRTSLMGAVLHLKNLLLDIDVLTFDYLDPPKRESLEEALLQLYVVDAIDGRGRITPLGKAMVQLPLDPSLCRALLAATDLECLQDALTVAAMLSCEQIVLPGREQRGGRAEGRTAGGSAALQEFTQDGLGDHIFLLRLYQAWSEAGFSAAFVKQLGLNLRSLNFARDVRKQLHRVCSEHLRKLSPQAPGKRRREGPGDAQACGEELRRMAPALERDRRDHWDAGDADSEPEAIDSPPDWRLTRPRGMSDLTALRKALAVGFANKVARRMPRHNGYRVCNEKGQLAMVHPACAELAEDDEGMQPDFLIFHELHASGARCFLRHVCAINGDWVARQLAKLRDADVACLGSGKPSEKKKKTGLQAGGGKAAENAGGEDAAEVRDGSRRNTEQTVSDARARYLARKAARK